ncbi:Testis-specific serine/threonine-protein kinase 4 [Pitangus sulphuratus]|nr:Testis-specific serine/threonine-protein kinase 4 [Pitangus sulphuratus]
MLPLLCRDLNLKNILLDSEDDMKISRFFRRVVLRDVSGESLGTSTHPKLPTKAVLSQTFCQSYAYACPEVLQEKPRDLFLENT